LIYGLGTNKKDNYSQEQENKLKHILKELTELRKI